MRRRLPVRNPLVLSQGERHEPARHPSRRRPSAAADHANRLGRHRGRAQAAQHGRTDHLRLELLLVTATVAAGVNLGFRGAHVHSAVLGGGWAPAAAGLVVLAAGVALRTWAILTLGRLFKFVVVIQDGHRVVASGPYRLLRHPSYTGGLLPSSAPASPSTAG
jgi:protein-S-isoprenylcysteine O-methyltransferase Ste14